MKKTALYLLATLGMAAYLMANSSWFMDVYVNAWSNDRRPAFLNWDKNKYGDLYGLSYLARFRQPVGGLYYDERSYPTANKDIDLWIIGDSFLAHTLKPGNDAYLKNANLRDMWWGLRDKKPRKLDFRQSKINVLIFEATERFVRDDVGRRRAVETDVLPAFEPAAGTDGVAMSTSLQERLRPTLIWLLTPGHGDKVDQNLETLFFGYEFLAPIKEAKAALNYSGFARTAPYVYASPDGNRLFYSDTMSDDLNGSSYKPIPDAELDNIVANLNLIADTYRQKGFDEVFLSLTPNAATITARDPRPYNQLIPRLQRHPALRMRVIDIYSRMKQMPEPDALYWPNDTHWTSNGFKLWVDAANEAFRALTETRATQTQ